MRFKEQNIAEILPEDEDFFGRGVAIWAVETLIAPLERRGG